MVQMARQDSNIGYWDMWLADVDEAIRRAKERRGFVYHNSSKSMTTSEWPELVTAKIFNYLDDEKTAESWLNLFPELKTWHVVKKTMRKFKEQNQLRRRYYGSWKCSVSLLLRIENRIRFPFLYDAHVSYVEKSYDIDMNIYFNIVIYMSLYMLINKKN